MSDIKLGELAPDGAQRDAIHVAVAPVVAAESLRAGMRVGVIAGKAFENAQPVVGIVDPFLSDEVQQGERFWLFLLPKTACNLRHEWDHPAFTEEQTTPAAPAGLSAAEVALRAYADEAGMPWDKFKAEAADFIINGDYDFRIGKLTGDTGHPIWELYRKLTGLHPHDKECRGC